VKASLLAVRWEGANLYVQTTTSRDADAGSFGFSSGKVLQIPREYYNPAIMTRLGTALTTAQLAALVPWSSSVPGWPYPINGE
jgi:hypothetical protein